MHSKNDKHDVVDMVIRIIYEIFEKRTSNHVCTFQPLSRLLEVPGKVIYPSLIEANYEPEEEVENVLIARCLTS